MNEKRWVHSLVARLARDLERLRKTGIEITVSDGRKLPYSCEIRGYAKDGSFAPNTSSYETDLLICDSQKDGSWIPRVIVECKIGGSITTHDALTYSTKAATHKHVHPYLRYGFLAGEREHYAIHVRLVKHGAHFDFMATWRAAKPTKAEWRDFCALVVEEIRASRAMQDLLTTNRAAKRKKYHILHRPLRLK